MGVIMTDNLLYALEIMLKGMSGIMLVSIIIAIIVSVLGKMDNKSNLSKKS